jgi:hypothetical protein
MKRSVPFALLFQIRSTQNVKAVATDLAGGVASHTNQLVNYAKECVKPAWERSVSAFKCARFFSPAKVRELLHQQELILTSFAFSLS